ncbi:proprotein convertase P-domain-containing protein [Erythrobacter alti]|uniref:proprotein convertase P-domain-containing protein n=1 Tax=Erythrobacter alti TaxID=1896145 RepID=UPI0030F42039
MITRIFFWLAGVLATLLFADAAQAQQTFTYVNTVNGTISPTASPCTNPLVRTYNVTQNFVLADVDIGARGAHTYRGNLRFTLQHPDGTRVRVVNENGNIFGDNFNWRLNDEGTQVVNSDGNGNNYSTAAVNGGFQHNFIPNAALSAFDGKNSQGTWRLEICHASGPNRTGEFYHSELYLTSQPTGPFADLSLQKTVNNSSPASGSNVVYSVTVSNAGNSTQSATATVLDQLPPGASYLSHSGSGSYAPATGIWSLPTLAPGQSTTLTITALVTATAGATITNVAEVRTSDRNDFDSTPGNGSIAEDDNDFASFTVSGTRQAGIPPTLACPDGFLTFDWAGRNWPVGSTTNNYTLTGLGAFNWSLSSPAPWLDVASLGGQHPRLTTAAQNTTSLSKAIDFDNATQFATTTVTLGQPVDGAQFTIFDVDYAANDFADRVTVTGRLGTDVVIPVLTNGTANYVIGNSAYGDAGSAADQPNGNVIVTFDQAIDSIIIEYGNHALAPANPDGQAIQMSGGIQICRPYTDLIVVKSSAPVEDPVNGTTDPLAIPGARIRYCIQITNTGSATATAITAVDNLPTEVTYLAGTILSGLTCEAANTAEDDDAAGADEADPAGANFAAGTVTYSRASLSGGSTAAFTFEATIN